LLKLHMIFPKNYTKTMRKQLSPSAANAQQTILLDANAYILSSCDSLFSTEKLRFQPVTAFSPFLESIFPVLQHLTNPMQFPRVEMPTDFLLGVYDFSFQKIMKAGQPYIKWTIWDKTQTYEAVRVKQQLHHSAVLRSN